MSKQESQFVLFRYDSQLVVDVSDSDPVMYDLVLQEIYWKVEGYE